jgi:hypothetical protein
MDQNNATASSSTTPQSSPVMQSGQGQEVAPQNVPLQSATPQVPSSDVQGKKVSNRNPKHYAISSIILGVVSFIFSDANIASFAAVVTGGYGIYFSLRNKAGRGAILLNALGIFLGILGFVVGVLV